ncbi:MAG: ParA family protein [Candidatus Omnitrophica bacterium]|nr:ParA family protein [Candidatus Omnitrophota bacterium]
MAKRIAVCNQKGGVGKTTTAVNLSAALAISGKRVLLIDLDPQGNATAGLGVERSGLRGSIYEALLGQDPLESIAIPTRVPDLFLVPSQPSLSGAEVELVGLPQREGRLKEALDSLTGNAYDLILVDSPPSLGLLTLNALVAAESVLIPLQCEYYALEGLSQLLETVRLVQEGLNPRLSIEGVLLTMADFRTKLTNDVIQEVRQFFGSKVYDVVIPRSVRLSEAPSHGLPIALFDPTSVGARAYRSLAEQLNMERENEDARDSRVGQRDSGPDPGRECGSTSTTQEPGPGSGGESTSTGRDPLGTAGINPGESIPTAETAR